VVVVPEFRPFENPTFSTESAKSGHCGECLHHHERTGFGFFDFTVEQQALSGGRFDLSQARAHYVA
jgi:hypothetical protein